MLSRYSEDEMWSRFVFDLKSYFGKMNSILGSVVPLAMFRPFIRSCFFVWPLPLARECTRCRKTKFTFHIQTVTFHKHWTFVRATAWGQILDIHSLRRLATRTNEQGLVLYSTYNHIFHQQMQYKTDIQYKWKKMKMWRWKNQNLVTLDFIYVLSFIIQLLNIAGAYRIRNWGSRRKLLRRNACHISNAEIWKLLARNIFAT